MYDVRCTYTAYINMDNSGSTVNHSETYIIGTYPRKYIRISEVSEPRSSGKNSIVYLETCISFTTSKAPYEPHGPE